MRSILSFCLLLSLVSCVNAETLKGTKGNDNLVVHAVSGEPEVAQAYELAGTGATGPNGEALRADDANDPLDPKTRTYFPGQPYDDQKVVVVGKDGADEFLVRTYISAKPAIVAQHVGDDGVIDWNGVAGENNNVHDHWVDYFGVVQINDYDASEGDTIRVQGHTVTLKCIEQVGEDVFIEVYSQQGNGGGAHDEDCLGYIWVRDTAVADVNLTFTGTNDGITETFDEFLALVAYYDTVYETLQKNKTRVKRRGK